MAASTMPRRRSTDVIVSMIIVDLLGWKPAEDKPEV
jgi:hypothetical protein